MESARSFIGENIVAVVVLGLATTVLLLYLWSWVPSAQRAQWLGLVPPVLFGVMLGVVAGSLVWWAVPRIGRDGAPGPGVRLLAKLAAVSVALVVGGLMVTTQVHRVTHVTRPASQPEAVQGDPSQAYRQGQVYQQTAQQIQQQAADLARQQQVDYERRSQEAVGLAVQRAQDAEAQAAAGLRVVRGMIPDLEFYATRMEQAAAEWHSAAMGSFGSYASQYDGRSRQCQAAADEARREASSPEYQAAGPLIQSR